MMYESFVTNKNKRKFLDSAADEADEVLQGLDNFACGLHGGNETEKE